MNRLTSIGTSKFLPRRDRRSFLGGKTGTSSRVTAKNIVSRPERSSLAFPAVVPFPSSHFQSGLPFYALLFPDSRQKSEKYRMLRTIKGALRNPPRKLGNRERVDMLINWLRISRLHEFAKL